MVRGRSLRGGSLLSQDGLSWSTVEDMETTEMSPRRVVEGSGSLEASDEELRHRRETLLGSTRSTINGRRFELIEPGSSNSHSRRGSRGPWPMEHRRDPQRLLRVCMVDGGTLDIWYITSRYLLAHHGQLF
jgi:hypothetical protein